MPPSEYTGPVCGTCLIQTPIFHYSVAAFDYRPPLNNLIGNFKYHAKLHNGRVLSHFLLLAIEDFYQNKALPELIIPVPLHPHRLRKRGYNQAIEIARYLSMQLKVPMNKHLCIRQKDTQAQMKLSALERQHNLRSAFRLSNPEQLNAIKRVAIVDDVTTTMATCSELSKLLVKNGVHEIHIWSLARTCK